MTEVTNNTAQFIAFIVIGIVAYNAAINIGNISFNINKDTKNDYDYDYDETNYFNNLD